MTNNETILGAYLLERSTKIGLISLGIYGTAIAITSENTIYLISGLVIGTITFVAAFSGIPPKLVTGISKKRGQLYLTFFSLFVPLCIFITSIFIASLSILVLTGGINLPWDLQLAFVLEILVGLLNLGVLIVNAMAISKSRKTSA